MARRQQSGNDDGFFPSGFKFHFPRLAALQNNPVSPSAAKGIGGLKKEKQRGPDERQERRKEKRRERGTKEAQKERKKLAGYKTMGRHCFGLDPRRNNVHPRRNETGMKIKQWLYKKNKKEQTKQKKKKGEEERRRTRLKYREKIYSPGIIRVLAVGSSATFHRPGRILYNHRRGGGTWRAASAKLKRKTTIYSRATYGQDGERDSVVRKWRNVVAPARRFPVLADLYHSEMKSA